MKRGVEKLAAGNGFARKITTASTCAIEAARNKFTFRPSNGSLKHPGGNSSNDRLFYKMKQFKYLLEFRVLESNETRFLRIVCDDFVLGRVRSIKMQIQTRDLDK